MHLETGVFKCPGLAVWSRLLIAVFFACNARVIMAQTPSPLQEWQYSGGVVLARLFEPNLPKFRTILGVAAEVQPVYDGSDAYRVQGGPVINIQYRDVAFVTTGNGIGYNFLRGDHYQVGLGLTYDLGRKMSDDLSNLHGMGDIGASAGAKFFASWVLSKKFPLIMRVDAREFFGGVDGAVGGCRGVSSASRKLEDVRDVCRSIDHARHPPLHAESLRRYAGTIAGIGTSGI